MTDHIKEKLSLLKALPGCYLMKNKDNKIIYVGKAKKLCNRVSSYFNRPHTGKTAKLVSEIIDFDTIITTTEKEALLLEINLIHLYNPPFNIMLKDDKSYPYIELKLDKAPYLKISRNVKSKKSKLYGPYPQAQAARSSINLLNRIFPLRKCQTLPKKPCLYYHMGQCLGPCINTISDEDNKRIIKSIDDFMKGNTDSIIKDLKDKMLKASDALEFETANEYKNIIDGINYITENQHIMTDANTSMDVIAFHIKDEYIAISILSFRDGFLKVKHNEVLGYYGDSESEFLSYVMQYYEHALKPKILIMPNIIDEETVSEALKIKVITPTRGKYFDLLKMAAQNAIEGMEEKYLTNKTDGDNIIVLEELGKRIGIPTPYRIELIDNSHLQGDSAVGAVVVFTNGIPSKKLYRKYRLNTEETRDDTSSMYEVLYRRYYRILTEQTDVSDLLIVDGSITQIEAAKKAIRQLNFDIPIVGLAKDNRHSTEALVLENGEYINIKDNKPLFFLLTKMQDEVHRFVIGYHRNERSKKMLTSKLDEIDGIGSVRKEALLKAFGNIEGIKKADISELIQFVPESVAKELKEKL